MLYLLLILALAGLVYAGWRLTKSYADRPKTRVIGPDDDPDFLWRLGRDDNTLMRKTIQTQLEATTWPSFAAVSPSS